VTPQVPATLSIELGCTIDAKQSPNALRASQQVQDWTGKDIMNLLALLSLPSAAAIAACVIGYTVQTIYARLRS
jgi:hypothetical protein